jgi:NAD(P)-dependent dehydrogenase (short-subunit alcohol dehydrogenase family)
MAEMTKTAVITGSAGGIGQSLCLAFKDAGYKTIGLDLKHDQGASDVCIAVDLNNICLSSEYRTGIIVKIKKQMTDDTVHVLINNAAVQILKPSGQLTLDDWQHTLNVNLLAPFLLTQALLTELEKTKGSVINIASVHAVATKPEFVCYATSKAALVGLTKSMAVDLGPKVRINAICPAAVATPMLLAGFEGRAKELEVLSGMHPVGRIGRPEEIAQLACFLASSQAGFITGATFYADGGICSRLHDPV